MVTKIEWVRNQDGTQGITLNPVKGLCPVGCSYCYARRLYKRFKWNPELRYQYGWEYDLPIKPSRIFVGSTIELFHENIKPVWRQDTIQIAGANPQHTFIFLTKCPQNLPKEFPDNCWVGVSVTANGDMTNAYYGLASTKAKVRFISFEPLLGKIGMSDHVNIKEYLDWVIIGAQTPFSKKTSPKIEWIKEIIEAVDKAKIPIFLKNNLHKVFENDARLQMRNGIVPDCVIPIWASNKERYIRHLRQEFPKR